LLVDLVHPLWPDLIEDTSNLGYLTSWYMTSGYPDFDESAPTQAEVREGLAAVVNLKAVLGVHIPAELKKNT
jgi:hypothetical protein